MGATYRCLMLGAGGMGSRWIREIWQPFRDRMEFAGLVDPNPAALHAAGDWLGLPPAGRFLDAREAFATVDADFCCIVTPPDHHREAVELACARGKDILSEKPIADTLEACGAIARAVKAASVRMMVTQNYRYTRRILTLMQAVSELGAVNYAVARYASACSVAFSAHCAQPGIRAGEPSCTEPDCTVPPKYPAASAPARATTSSDFRI